MPAEESRDLRSIADIDRIVHEPSRLLIMAHLYVIESADFLFLMSQTELTKGNLSSHLMKLESAGYVEVKKEFVAKTPRTILSLTAAGRDAFEAYRSKMGQVLEKLKT